MTGSAARTRAEALHGFAATEVFRFEDNPNDHLGDMQADGGTIFLRP